MRLRRISTGHRDEVRRGIWSVAPLLLGYVPFGLVVGARVGDGDFVAGRWVGTLVIMGGSAQLTVLELLDDGAALAVVIVSGLLVNARLAAYSASLAGEWASATRRYRLLAAASVIDPTWVLAQRRRDEGGSESARRAYYAAAATTLCVAWVAIVTAGAFVGAAGGLRGADVVIPLCLLALVAPRLTRRGECVPLMVAAAVGWLAADMAAGTGVALAALCAATWPVRAASAPAHETQSEPELEGVRS